MRTVALGLRPVKPRLWITRSVSTAHAGERHYETDASRVCANAGDYTNCAVEASAQERDCEAAS
jgi:hypothetical protein